jgi:8-oxo-dGTP pyrophosphatase MutT (NUDIX family)
MLDLDPNREGVSPRDAATLLVVRDRPQAQRDRPSRDDPPRGGVEVFCVERHRSGFLGGAIVFPGGKLDPSDLDATWRRRATAPRAPASPIAGDEAQLRGLAVAACREALEEAAILPVVAGPSPGGTTEDVTVPHGELLAWRERLARGEATLGDLLEARGLRLDLAALHPFARWITPAAEARRFDTRFFLFVADSALSGAHDDRETTASFWASPGEVLRRFAGGELQLAPPTHRTLEVFATAASARDAVRIAEESCVEVICPRVVPHRDARGETVALVLPGDREHDVRQPRSPGKSRYVLRGDRFLPEDAPP